MPNPNKSRDSPRKPASRTTQISKKLSWLLRHGAEKENLTLGPGGYANVADVLTNRNLRSLKVTFDELRRIVAENDKQRYQLVRATELVDSNQGDLSAAAASEQAGNSDLTSSDPTLWLIRATQGHSLKLQEEDPSHSLLTPLSLAAPDLPQVAVHGTTRAAWPLILATGGLKPMGRNHVHFATGVPEGFTILTTSATASMSSLPLDPQQQKESDDVALPVISGMRKSSTILIFLDLRKALEMGIKFGMSSNGVILSEGNADGLVPVEVFRRVEDWRAGKVLLENGKAVDTSEMG